MTDTTNKNKAAPARDKAAERQERVAQALRDNLRRRKQQKQPKPEGKDG